MNQKEIQKINEELFHFIEAGSSAFHVINNCECMLKYAGFIPLEEKDTWKLVPGEKYYVNRNGSSLIAFSIPQGESKGFHMAAAHSDSPTFKIKENPEMSVEEHYIKLNTEKYGGSILSTWLDRPLSIAGRIITNDGVKLVNIEKDLCIIPNLAIHMSRDMNKGVEYNPQVDMLPLFSDEQGKDAFWKLIAENAGVSEEEILGHDLYLYVREKGKVIGLKEEFICSPRLDDLQCVFGLIKAVTQEISKNYVNLCAIFDNEEVGSGTAQGADSTFLDDILHRIADGLGWNDIILKQKIADSFMISADNGHAVHPNHPEKADPTNRPYLNGGIVIKYNGSQKYTTDGISAAKMKALCKAADVPYQTYANRSDVPGGATLGNISTSHISVKTVDVGLAQLAMHSALETAGSEDTLYFEKVMKEYYKNS